MTAPSKTSVSLPAVFDLDALDGVRDRLLEAIEVGQVKLDAHGVERVATNALLMLLAAGQTARGQGSAMRLLSPSAPLCGAIERLGLNQAFAEYLEL